MMHHRQNIILDITRCIHVADTWDKLDRLESDWNRLWLNSEVYSRQFFLYKFIKCLTLSENPHQCRTWTIYCSENNVVNGIKPFVLRKIRLLGNINLTCAMNMPGALIHRHGLLAAQEDAKILLCGIVNQLKGSGIDLCIIAGLSEQQSQIMAKMLREWCANYTTQKLSDFMPSQLPGMHPADLCAISFDGTWEQFLNSRSQKLRQNLRRAQKAIQKAGRVEFIRYLKNQFICGDRPISKEQMIRWIEEIEENCWQRSINRHFYRNGKANSLQIFNILWERQVIDISFVLVDNVPLSYCLGSCFNDYGSAFFTAYKEDASKLSPGIIMWFEIIKTTFQKTTMKSLNLTGSHHLYKHQIADNKDSAFELIIYGNTLKARSLYLIRKAIPNRIFASISRMAVRSYGIN